MKRVLLLVEGQTEVEFVRDLLGPHLGALGIHISATMICTRLTEGRREDRGGGSNYDHVRGDILRLLRSRPDAVSTMIDYYRMPRNFPGRSDLPDGLPLKKLEHLEDAFARDIGDRCFIPNLILHEFEALLFASPDVLARHLERPKDRAALDQLLAAVDSPEEINDGPQSAPSKRIGSLIPRYRKTFHGPLIASQIGLEQICARCPHFGAWIKRLEQVGAVPVP